MLNNETVFFCKKHKFERVFGLERVFYFRFFVSNSATVKLPFFIFYDFFFHLFALVPGRLNKNIRLIQLFCSLNFATKGPAYTHQNED